MLSEPSSPLWQSWEVDFHAPRFRFYGYCAPSLGRTAGSDYSAIITLAVDGDSGLAYVYDADLQRRHPDQIITDILDKERQLRRHTRGRPLPLRPRRGHPSAICTMKGVFTMNQINTKDLRAIRAEDVPEAYQDIVEALGLEVFLTLTDLCGGLNLYIPKRESLEREGRDREIRARFDGGNTRALAAQFRLSERQIRKILSGTRT